MRSSLHRNYLPTTVNGILIMTSGQTIKVAQIFQLFVMRAKLLLRLGAWQSQSIGIQFSATLDKLTILTIHYLKHGFDHAIVIHFFTFLLLISVFYIRILSLLLFSTLCQHTFPFWRLGITFRLIQLISWCFKPWRWLWATKLDIWDWNAT